MAICTLADILYFSRSTKYRIENTAGVQQFSLSEDVVCSPCMVFLRKGERCMYQILPNSPDLCVVLQIS